MTDDNDDSQGPPNNTPSREEILAAIAAMAPPTTPADAVTIEPAIEDLVRRFDPARTIDILAGIQTDPRFQANNVRLEIASRLVIGLSNGSRRPKAAELSLLLNSLLAKAHVNWLEDPIEDFFVEAIPTPQGEFRIFSGTWEKAAVHTEAVLSAFEDLPNGPPKIEALRSVFALLRLSNELVRRSGYQPGIIGGGEPKGDLQLPSDERLAKLSAQVRFSLSDLEHLGIAEDDLSPFFMGTAERDSVLHTEPGNSGIEFRPLFKTRHGLIVTIPANISTAVRAHLIDVATAFSIQKRLQANLFRAKAKLLRDSSFRYIPTGQVSEADGLMYCERTFEISKGRYLHVIFSVDGFEGWPQRVFGSVTPHSESWTKTLLERMRAAKATAVATAGFKEGMTLWMPSGWGAGRSFGFTPDEDLDSWMFLAAEPSDIATITTCEDGSLSDIWRLEKQRTLVEQDGFELMNINGLLNVFHWWRITEHALIPPHEIDIAPPTMINFDTGLLLNARQEAFAKFGRKAACDETGRWHMVAKLERELRYQALENVYASLDDVGQGRLTGTVQENGCEWWVRVIEGENNRDVFETWRTVLIWAGQVMTPFLKSIRKRDIIDPIAFNLKIEEFPENYDFHKSAPLTDNQIEAGIVINIDTPNSVSIHLKTDWFVGFNRPDNFAERCLGVKILEAACKLFGVSRTSADLHSLVFGAAGSPDFRHRHAFHVERAIDQLSASGLIAGFRSIPVSAGALAKHGSAWEVHSRTAGARIAGKYACLDFIQAFVTNCREKLLRNVALFNKQDLVVMALKGLQAAIAEEGQWRRTARALRAIHGVEKDFATSLKHVTMANGVLRANSMLAEIASVVAHDDGGQFVGRMDMEDIQAQALQLFQSSDNYPAFKVDRIEPTIHISPVGDPLYDHEFHETTLERSARMRHAREREESSESYGDRFEKRRPTATPDHAFEEAVRAEYGVPLEVFREFATATALLAREAGRDVIVLRKSELISRLKKIDLLKDMDFAPIIDRLTLPKRPVWDQIPAGFSKRDIDLSKFDRRLSVIARPIVCLSGDQDPLLVVAPGVIERALAHNISGAVHGTLQNEFWVSREMPAYAGKAGGKIGLEFNLSLAKSIESLGLDANASVKPWACTNEKSTDQLKKLGDRRSCG